MTLPALLLALHAAAVAAPPAAAAPAPPAAAVPAPAPPPASTGPGPAPAAAAADHRRENKALVVRYLTEVLAAGKLDKLDEIVAQGFVDRTPGASGRHGPAAARQAQQKLRDLFARVEYRPQALIAEGDQVAARYLVLATPKPEPGAPAPPALLLDGVALFRVRGGRIQEVFALNDQIGLLRQLGYTLVPPGASPPPAAERPAAPAPSSPPPPPAERPTARGPATVHSAAGRSAARVAG